MIFFKIIKIKDIKYIIIRDNFRNLNNTHILVLTHLYKLQSQELRIPLRWTGISSRDSYRRLYPQHNTNYRALISKYVGSGAGGGEARTVTDVLATDKERKSRMGKARGKRQRGNERNGERRSPRLRPAINSTRRCFERRVSFQPLRCLSMSVPPILDL